MHYFKSFTYLLLIACCIVTIIRWGVGSGENFDLATLSIQQETGLDKLQMRRIYKLESSSIKLDLDSATLENATPFQKAIMTKNQDHLTTCLKTKARGGDGNPFENRHTASDFSEFAHGLVQHVDSGLVWLRCPIGTKFKSGRCESTSSVRAVDPYTASMIVNEKEIAGFNDWRVPTIHELSLIFQPRCSGANITEFVYPNAAEQDITYRLLYSAHTEIENSDFAVTFPPHSAKTGVSTDDGQLFLVRGGSGL